MNKTVGIAKNKLAYILEIYQKLKIYEDNYYLTSCDDNDQCCKFIRLKN